MDYKSGCKFASFTRRVIFHRETTTRNRKGKWVKLYGKNWWELFVLNLLTVFSLSFSSSSGLSNRLVLEMNSNWFFILNESKLMLLCRVYIGVLLCVMLILNLACSSCVLIACGFFVTKSKSFGMWFACGLRMLTFQKLFKKYGYGSMEGGSKLTTNVLGHFEPSVQFFGLWLR